MVKLLGHVAIGLFLTLPVWFVWERGVSLAFIGFTLATVMLPDVDIALRMVIKSIHHHGFTHTLVFVAGVAVVAGAFAATVLWPHLDRWIRGKGYTITRLGVFLFGTGGLFLGGVGHLIGDMMSAPDIAQPIEPLWPFLDKPVSFDVVYYSSTWWNLGFLIVTVLAHLVISSRDGLPVRQSFGIERE